LLLGFSNQLFLLKMATTVFPTQNVSSSSSSVHNPAIADSITRCMAVLASLSTDAQRQEALKQFLVARPVEERKRLLQLDPHGLNKAKEIYEKSSAQKKQELEARLAAGRAAKQREDEAKAKAAAAAAAATASPAQKEKSKKEKKKAEKKTEKHKNKKTEKARSPSPSSSSSDSSDSSDSSSSNEE
jgi:hypothetical protein